MACYRRPRLNFRFNPPGKPPPPDEHVFVARSLLCIGFLQSAIGTHRIRLPHGSIPMSTRHLLHPVRLLSKFKDWQEARKLRNIEERKPETKRPTTHLIPVIAGIAGALTAVLLLFPPWNETIDIPYRLHSLRALGYGWIWSPPSPSSPRASIAIDWNRLPLELFALWALAAPILLGIWYRKGVKQANTETQSSPELPQKNADSVPQPDSKSASMNSEIVRHISPQEQELAEKRQELAILQAELTEREFSAANLRAELGAFEGRYLREVGLLYAELDDWNARIAELVAEATGTEQAKSAATDARARAEESRAAAHEEAARAADFSPSPELRKLFREVVKLVHPDNATDEADRTVRNKLMTEANLAYRLGDADVLRRILEEYKSSPESVKGDGSAADLQRVLRQIERIVKRLAQIESEVAELTSSEIAKLMATAETTKARGRDLLAEMKKDVLRRIELARKELEDRASEMRPK